jgi:hypothetical protein
MRAGMLAHFWDFLPYMGRILAFRRNEESIFSVIKDEKSLSKASKD